jgi:hypothetical protein
MDALLEILQQQLLEERGVLYLDRQQDLLGRGVPRQIILLDKRRDGLLRAVGNRQDLIVLVEEISVYIMQTAKQAFASLW